MLINRFYSVLEICIHNFRTYVLIHFKRKEISIIVSNSLSDDDYNTIVKVLSSKYGIKGFDVTFCDNFVINS